MDFIDLTFEILPSVDYNSTAYSGGCSDARSDCCTRICRGGNGSDEHVESIDAWEKYLEVNSGVLQY